MATMTVRGMPDDLHGWLKKQAETHHRSVNKEIITLLESLRRSTSEPRRRATYEELLKICEECAALPELDSRSADETVGYDENGIPS